MTFDTWTIILYAAAVLGGLALAWGAGMYGCSKGYSFWLCALLAVVMSPFAAWVVIALLPEREQKHKVPADLALAIEFEKTLMRAESRATT